MWVPALAGRPTDASGDDGADFRFNLFDTCLSMIEGDYELDSFSAPHGIAFPEYVGCDALSGDDAAATWPRYLQRIQQFAEVLSDIIVMVVCREIVPRAGPWRAASVQRTAGALEDNRSIPTSLSAGRRGVGAAPEPVTAQRTGTHGGVGVSTEHRPTAAGTVTCSRVFVPLILEVAGVIPLAGLAARAPFSAAANAINGHTPGLWGRLVDAYREDFEARGITRDDVSNLLVFSHTGRRDYIQASDQERLLNPVDNGGESQIDTELYQHLSFAALAWLAPQPPVARPSGAGRQFSEPEAPQRSPIRLLGEIL